MGSPNGSLSSAIADALRASVISGALKPGERLLEDVIADEHHVSRVPVREALRRLEAEGFVTLTPFRGATVAAPSRHDALELMAVRRGLEVLAARLAAERRGAGFESELLDAIEQESDAARRHDVEAMPSIILRFHELVSRASGNGQLVELLARVLKRISWGFEMDIDERAASASADHAAITRAILNGSEVQAGYLMDEHIAKDEALYRAKASLDI